MDITSSGYKIPPWSLLKTLPFSWYGLIGTDHRAVENWKEIGVGIQKDEEWPESGDKN